MKQLWSYSWFRPVFVSSDRGNSPTKIRLSTSMPTLYALNTLGLAEGFVLLSERLFLFFILPAYGLLWPSSHSVLTFRCI